MDEKDIKIQNLEKSICELYADKKDFEERITRLETVTAVTDEQVKMIFRILNEIKDSVFHISEKIDDIEKKPFNLMWSVLAAVASAIVIAGIKFIR